ncbi:hypothetical protein JCM21900_003324 [Sporobolomyces salmonicolor]
MLPPPSPRSACKPSPVGGIGGTANALIATGVGSLCIQLRNGRTVTIKNTLRVEGFSTMLISAGQLWDLHGVATHSAEHATLTHNGTVVPQDRAQRARSASSTVSLPIHPQCKVLASHPLELVRSDVLSVDAASLAGKRYVVTFVDNFSRRLWVEPLDCKSDVFEVFKWFKAAAETESGRKLQHFRSDNGGEYSSCAFCAYLDKHGIAFESPPPYSHASNGVNELVYHSILEGIRVMQLQAGADKSLWAEALLAFVFVKNHSPHTTLNSKVPLAVWHGCPVRVDMLCIWGCRAWHTLSKTKLKLNAPAVPLVFVGYDGDTRAYRLLDPESKCIVRSRDTRLQEDLFPLASASPPAPVDAIPPNPPAALANDSPLSVTVDRDVPRDNDRLCTPAPMEADMPAAPPQTPAVDIPATRLPQPVFVHDTAPSSASPDPIDFLSDPFAAQAVTLTGAIEDDMGTHEEAFSLPSRDPRNHREALTDVDSAGWLDGEKGEFLSLLNDYKVFHLLATLATFREALTDVFHTVDHSSIPATAKILSRHFHYRRKGYGKTRALKVRLVAQDYNQHPGLDFRETFAPVAKFTSIGVLLALTAQQRMHIQQAGIDKAYLHANLNEELYMHIPDGVDGPDWDGKVLKLDRALYGLKQARHPRNANIHATLEHLRYCRTSSDICVQPECHTAPTPMIPNQQLIPAPPDLPMTPPSDAATFKLSTPSSLMVADIFTKSLPLPAFLAHRSSLGLQPLD